MAHGSKKVIVAALLGNLLIAVSKLVAAVLTGSAALFAETLHSFADTGNQVLLLHGLRRSGRPADAAHPFGYGKEQYFWAFVVAIVLFALGAVFSLVEGVEKVLAPHPVENPLLSFIVLGLALVFEGSSFRVAWIEFNRSRRGKGVLRALAETDDPVTMTVLLEDTAAMIGLVLASLLLALALLLEAPVLDGVASILIGLVLAGVAYFLASAQRAFLVGKGLLPEETAEITRRVLAISPVVGIANLATMHLGAEVLLCADLTFAHGTSAGEIIQAVDRVEKALREALPRVTRIYLEADGLARAERMLPRS